MPRTDVEENINCLACKKAKLGCHKDWKFRRKSYIEPQAVEKFFTIRFCLNFLSSILYTNIKVIFFMMFFSMVSSQGGFFPKIRTLERLTYDSINVSSTCGLTSELHYCLSSSDVRSLSTCNSEQNRRTCRKGCCETCRSSSPLFINLQSTAIIPTTGVYVSAKEKRPNSGMFNSSLNFENGYLLLKEYDATFNFSFASWLKIREEKKSSVILEKVGVFSLHLQEYLIEFSYFTTTSGSIKDKLSIGNIDVRVGNWYHIVVTLSGFDFTLFINGKLERTAFLSGVLNDKKADLRVGQNFSGFMQEMKIYRSLLTNREVKESMTGVLPNVPYSECRCPETAPRIMDDNPFFCIKNTATVNKAELRLSKTFHPPEFMLDRAIITHWISNFVEKATIDINLRFPNLHIYLITLSFYSPMPEGIEIQRSVDFGKSYISWQFYSVDCEKSFNMANDGPLDFPDSVNCLQVLNPRTSSEVFIFQPKDPGPQGKPQRPYDTSIGCSDIFCSERHLNFLKATNVRFIFTGHALVTNALHRYYGVQRIIIGGLCDCYGHSDQCIYDDPSIANPSFKCQCEPSTFTMGTQCNTCQPLYNDKLFARGTGLKANPCKKCECHNHADSCYYNATLDQKPNDRTALGGGVCIDCKHNTVGRFCDKCKPLFYRPSNKPKNASDACAPCNCESPGTKPGFYDCQKDDSMVGVIAGQCACKKYAAGRTCSICKDGYYLLTTDNPEGCIECSCNVIGTLGNKATCHISSGQCDCKANVIGVKCTNCKVGYYGLSRDNPLGCNPCNCNPLGKIPATTCNVVSGQCQCRDNYEGRDCGQCKTGFFGSLCQRCDCSNEGTIQGTSASCDRESGQCNCKEYVTGTKCDQCKPGYFALSSKNPQGCSPCSCDINGTQPQTGCKIDGSCACKELVTGSQCNFCKPGSFGLGSDRVKGCRKCNCSVLGTVSGETSSQDQLSCTTSGQCSCISNVVGKKCDQCAPGYYWNPNGPGCLSCSCDASGSLSPSCNGTGFCNCIQGTGVGGKRCDGCQPGFYNYTNGRCTRCGCNIAGSLKPDCSAFGICQYCKTNVEGRKCDICRDKTKDLKAENPEGCSGPPSEQGPASVISSSSQWVYLMWDPPDKPNGLITKYNLYQNNSLIYSGLNRTFNVTGLLPFTTYVFSIEVSTEGGLARNADDLYFTTKSDLPLNVSSPTISNVGTVSVTVNWKSPATPNGIIKEYVLMLYNATSSIEVYRGIKLNFDVVDLKPFTLYNFSVLACNMAGCTSSKNVSILTNPTAPEYQPPPKITPLKGGKTVYVEWDEPDQPNGIIAFYDLYIREAPFIGVGNSIATNLNPQFRNFTAENLKPNTEYEFRVTSYTASIQGSTSSVWVKGKTSEGVPGGASKISPTAVAINSSMVSLSWNAPFLANGVIIRYEIFIYEKSTNFLQPTIKGSTTGAIFTLLIDSLKAYTNYQFSVKACNSVGCSPFSSKATVITAPSKPENQIPPFGTPKNSSQLFVQWNTPATLNGPNNLFYSLEQLLPSFSDPPEQVSEGIHFPGFGYYQLPNDLFPGSTITVIEFYFKTRYLDGVLFFASSEGAQTELLAIEFRDGCPWFVFDPEDGPAAFTISKNKTFNDNKWHHVLITRQSRVGRIIIDQLYTGSGLAPGTKNFIGQLSYVYIGGLPNDFKIIRTDSGNATIKRMSFIGCIRAFKFNNIMVDFTKSVKSKNVSPLSDYCPVKTETGLYFKGGGFIRLKSGIFKGLSSFQLSFSLKTLDISAPLVLIGSITGNFFTLYLKNGTLYFQFKTHSESQMFSLSKRELCDGNYHKIVITNDARKISSSIDGIVSSVTTLPLGFIFNDPVYIGGFSETDPVAKDLASFINLPPYFSGCLQSLQVGTVVYIQGAVQDFHNVEFDGCPSSKGNGKCKNPEILNIYTGRDRSFLVNGLKTFTEYLFRVKSYHSENLGFSTSKWVPIRSGEGAPLRFEKPKLETLNSTAIKLSWTIPTVSGGFITYYTMNYRKNNITTSVVVGNVQNGILNNLSPATLYIITITAFTRGGSIESDVLTVTTDPAAPSKFRLPTVTSTPTSLNISWMPPEEPNGEILFYEVFLDGAKKFTSKVVTTVVITGLKVYTKYLLKVTVCNQIACISNSLDVFTDQLSPDGVIAPQVEVLGSSRVKVAWIPPATLNGEIQRYEILTSPNNSLLNLISLYNASATTFETVIDNLTPGTLYYFRIKAYTKAGGTLGDATQIKTKEGVPENIPLPKIVNKTSTQMTIQIFPPLSPNGVITKYKITQDSVAILSEVSLPEPVTVKNLKAYTRYVFQVRVCTKQGCGSTNPLEVFTSDGVPIGEIGLVSYGATASTVDLKWNALREPNGIITYRVFVIGEFFVNPLRSFNTFNGTKVCYAGNRTDERVRCQGLLPNEIYRIYVNGSNNAGFILSNEEVIRTAKDVPFGVAPPDVSVINSTAMVISWDEPKRLNGRLQKYILYGVFPDILYTSFTTKVLQEGLSQNYLLANLKAYTNYTFYVEVYNDVGMRSSGRVTATTKQDVPQGLDPPHLKNITSRNAQLLIQQPSEPNGVIINYKIYINNTLANQTTNAMILLSNLTPFTLYEVKVSVCTVIGCTQSDVTAFRTLQDAPEGIAAPVLSVNGSTSIIIRWSPPIQANGIVNYRIQRRISGTNLTVTVGQLNDTEDLIFVDGNLEPFTRYDYRLVAQTSGGSSFSSYTSVQTLEGAPEEIDAPDLFVLSSDSILVKWKPPKKPNGQIISYCIKVSSLSECIDNKSEFEYTLKNLSSYVRYGIRIQACTSRGCNVSFPSYARTRPSLPENQPQPTAIESSNTSLQVRWSPSLSPNGPITGYQLERRTLESIVVETITSPTQWRVVFTGLSTIYDDKGLGIYSVQQYRVTCFTTEGQVLSEPSQGYRTGPGIPLAGPTVKATSTGFSQVSLQWTNPPIRELRGEAKSYTIFYETVEVAGRYVYRTVDGNTTSLTVNNLQPNTLYDFVVQVYNGLGRADSNPARARTFDGVPQGFNPPIVTRNGTTSLKLFWEPPKIPNGNIVNYTIIVNDKKMDTVAGNVNDHEQKQLQPFTTYTVKIQVCTSFVCILSGSSLAQTQPAPPNNMLAPSVLPITSTSIQVSWLSPLNPNGIMIGYELYRRSYGPCNEGGNVTKKCSYIICGLGEQLCGYQCYNPTTQVCCANTVHNIESNKQCCENSYVIKQRPDDVCCGGVFHQRQLSSQCCNGYYRQVLSDQVCCYSGDNAVVGMGDACCRDVPYFKNDSKICLCGALYERLQSTPRQCCGGKVVSGNDKCCGNEIVGTSYTNDPMKVCCGISYVSRDRTLCCHGEPGIYKLHSFSNGLLRSQKKCCGENIIEASQSCCKSTGYDNTTHVCSDVSSYGVTGCGNGNICTIANKDNSLCDRCNFDISQKLCYHVNGSYNGSLITSNGICVTSWIKILSNTRDPTKLSFIDSNLTPFTKYDYYVVGFNTVGNTSSPVNSSFTLMAGPDNLKPPIATLVGDIEIQVHWFEPTKPNGKITEYRLYRINWLNKKEDLVYQGLSLSYIDRTGLSYYTAYLYKISACTNICVNQTSLSLVNTNQGKPEGVFAPSLKALSSDTILINWTKPEKPNGFINRYDLQIFQNGTFVSLLPQNNNGALMSFTVRNLKPFTTYEFRILACTVKGCSSSPIASVQTLDGIPTGLQKPRIFVKGPKQVDIEWSFPENPNGRILYYVLFRNATQVANRTARNFSDVNVKPSTFYSYYYAARTNGGSAISEKVTVKTPESSPEGIKKPILSATSSTSISVSWSPPSSPNGVITSYAVLYQEIDKNIRRKNVFLTFSTVIRELKPFTEYIVRIYVCTNVGCATGDESSVFTLESLPKDMSAPLLQSKSSTIVEITWKPPANPNGKITSYHVDRRLETNGIPIKVFVGLSLKHIDASLQPFTEYQYKVTAYNSIGPVISLWVSVKTLEGTPEGIVSPKVKAINATSVELTWQKPSKPNGIIRNYTISIVELLSSDEKMFSCCGANTFVYVVGGLKPAVSYRFRVIVRTGGGSGFSEWTIFEMPNAVPSQVPTLQVNKNPDGLFDGRSMLLFWDEPENSNGIILLYEIFMNCSGCSINMKVYQGKERKALINRLDPFSNYSFALTICNSAGCVTGPSQVFQSGETIPVGQTPPQVDFVNSTSILLSWKPPLFPNGIITKYELIRQTVAASRRRRSENVIFSSVSALSYLDDSLTPHTTYEYKVRSSNTRGSTESSWLREKTLEALPGGVFEVNVTALIGSIVYLTWKPPTQPNGVILFYRVNRNETPVDSTLKVEYRDTSSALVAGNVYRYVVEACTKAGCLKSPSKLVTVLGSTPDSISPPKLQSLDSSSIKVSWEPPEKINGDIVKYQLFMDERDIPLFEGNLLQYTVRGLQVFTKYSFVVSVCTASKCLKSRSSETRTLEDIPFGIAAPKLFTRNAQSIELRWEVPTRPNGIIIYYLLLRDNVVLYNGTKTQYIDNTVIADVIYGYTVEAFNSVGSVKSSVTRGKTTSEGAPSNVSQPTATAKDATSIHLTWQAPSDVVVTSYSVIYGDNEVNVGNVFEYTIRGLKPYTSYDVRIKACVKTACSTSSPVSVQTLESLPGLQLPPTFDEKRLMDTSIHIQWEAPLRPNGAIVKYELYRRQTQSNEKLVFSGQTRSFVDTGPDITANTQYQYKVISFNSVGNTSSQWTVVTTKRALPQGVQPITPYDITRTSFRFNITKPLIPNGEINNYIVQIFPTKGDPLPNITTLSLSNIVSNLSPFTEYQTRVFACNNVGCTPSGFKVVRTSGGVPQGFSTPSVTITTLRSIGISWGVPTQPFGDILRYEVLLNQQCPPSSKPSCSSTVRRFNVGLSLFYVIPELLPYTTYSIAVEAFNSAGGTFSPTINVRTLAEDPVVVGPLVAAESSSEPNTILLDWSGTFDLRSEFVDYVLFENLQEAYSGNKVTSQRKNREVGVYEYTVRAITKVNGVLKSVTSGKVTVRIGNTPETAAQTSDNWYETLWFLALCALVFLIIVVIIALCCFRGYRRNRSVYVRQREPLPLKASQLTRQPSVVDFEERTPSRVAFTPTQKLVPRYVEEVPVSPRPMSSVSKFRFNNNDLVGLSMKESRFNESYTEDDDFIWETHSKRDLDSGLYDDSPSPSESEHITSSNAYVTIPRGRILFPDTHL